MDKFPHLSDTKFPNLDNQNVYAYQNNFNYDRWNANVKVKLCNVPWENDGSVVVKFDSDEKRDAYFNGLQGFEMETLFYNLITNNFDIPLPFSAAQKFNYLVVEYPTMTSPDAPIDFEENDGMPSKFFYFITSVKYGSPSCTQCNLQIDWWTTYINRVEIKTCDVARGHIGFSTNVEDYLKNPLENNDFLLAEDINFGEPNKVSHTNDVVLNEENYIFFAMAGNFTNEEENFTSIVNGVGSYEIFYIDVDDFDKFVTGMIDEKPKLARNVKAVWFAPKMLTQEWSQRKSFNGVIVHYPKYNHKELPLLKLNKALFNYPKKYENLAKLYTSPYAEIEITDANGNFESIKIQDTTGELKVYTGLNIAYPYLNVNTTLLGVGGITANNLSYRTTISRNAKTQGTWYKFIKNYDIPTFNIKVRNEIIDKLDNEYSRDSRLNAAKITKNIAYRNADLATKLVKENAKFEDSKNNFEYENIKQVQAKKFLGELFAKSNQNSEIHDELRIQRHQVGQWYNLINFSGMVPAAMTTASYALGGMQHVAMYGLPKHFAINSVSDLVTSGMVQQTVAGGIAAGAAAGAAAIGVAALNITISTGINGERLNDDWLNAQGMETSVTYNPDGTPKPRKPIGGEGYNGLKASLKNHYNVLSARYSDDYAKDMNETMYIYHRNFIQGCAMPKFEGMNPYLIRTRSYSDDVEKKNANDTYSITPYTIANERAQALLEPMHEYGAFTGSTQAATTPMLYSVNLKTLSGDCLAQTGDFFLKYGYAINRQIKFEKFNLMSKFTYWQLNSVWLGGRGVIEGASDRIKQMLENGVTVFRNPNDIGSDCIYDNKYIG